MWGEGNSQFNGLLSWIFFGLESTDIAVLFFNAWGKMAFCWYKNF